MVLVEQTLGKQTSRSSHPRGNEVPDATVFILDQEELEETINRTLAKAGCTLEQLREEARSGEFSSEANWRTWFSISSFVE